MGPRYLPAFILAAAATILFIVAVRRRLFGRIAHGFLIALVTAVAGASLLTASLLGFWGLAQGERILFSEFVDRMQTLGEVVDKEVRSDLTETLGGLERLASGISPEAARAESGPHPGDHLRPPGLRPSPPPGERGRRARDARALGDDCGRAGAHQSSVGVAFSLEGKPFISEAYLSDTSSAGWSLSACPSKGLTGRCAGR